MPFPPIRYLQWAHENIGGEPPPYGLAASSAAHLEPADLGVHLDGLGLTTRTHLGVPELVEHLADRYGVSRSRLLLTAGCTMANFLLCAALLRPGDRVVVERPAYEPLWRVPRALGARVVRLERRADEGYAVSPRRLAAALRRAPTRLVILSNLHNPSGRRTSPEAIGEIGALARRHGALVLWDEIYLECQEDPPPPAAVLSPRSCLSTLSLNKTYGLAGLKVGWALAPRAVLAGVRRVADYLYPCNPPLMERLALKALERIDDLRARSLEVSRRNREKAARWARGRGDLAWSEPEGGFIGFARFLRPGADSHRLEALLREEGQTVVAPGHHFGDPGGFRLGLGAPAPDLLERGLEHLGRALDRLPAPAVRVG